MHGSVAMHLMGALQSVAEQLEFRDPPNTIAVGKKLSERAVSKLEDVVSRGESEWQATKLDL
jgi:hypothetical protein